MRKYTVMVLWFMAVLWGLTGCVVTVNNNWGSDIHTVKTIDDIDVEQDYEADVEISKGRKKR